MNAETPAPDPAPPVVIIRRSRRDPNVVRLLVNGKQVARLRAAIASSLGLRSGAAWTEQLCARVMREIERQSLRSRALRLLALRGRYVQRLHELLVRRGGSADLVAEVVRELEEDGWLNDGAQAAQDIRSLLEQRRALSPEALTARLVARGCHPDTARRATASAISSDQRLTLALAHATRRLRGMGHLPLAARARRIASDLARRGLDEDETRSILERLELDGDGDAEDRGD